MKNYFIEKAISNSLLKKVGFFHQEKALDRFSFENEEKETLSMFVGSQIHKAIETNGISISDLKLLDTECFSELTSYEIQVLLSDDPNKGYFEVYKNKEAKTAKQVWDYATMSAKDAKSLRDVKDHITEILFKGSAYLNSKIGITDTDIVLDEYELTDGEKESRITDPQGVKYKIQNAYQAVSTSPVHNNIIERELFEECIEHFELEYYTEMYGYKVKGMFDRVIVLPEQKRAILIDYKTHHEKTTIEKSIIKYNYAHQLSWYLKLFEMWLKENGYTDYSVDTYIVGISTETAKVEVVPMSLKSLQCGQYGGYLKPLIYTLYNDNNEFDPFLNVADVEWLKHNNIWSSTDNNQFKRLGWSENFNIGIEAEMFEEYKV